MWRVVGPGSDVLQTPKEHRPLLGIRGLCHVLINAYDPPYLQRKGPLDLQVKDSTIYRCPPVKFQNFGRTVEFQLFSVQGE